MEFTEYCVVPCAVTGLRFAFVWLVLSCGVGVLGYMLGRWRGAEWMLRSLTGRES